MMATVIEGGRPGPRARPIGADGYERVLAWTAAVLLAAVLVALARGRAQWALVPWPIWAHIATILVALALTPVILLGRRGTRRHRVLGRVWVAAMLATAALSLLIHESGPGRFSVIHILSVAVLLFGPRIWWTARTGNLVAHRRGVRATVTGALLIAGFFTFPFGRLLGHWLFA